MQCSYSQQRLSLGLYMLLVGAAFKVAPSELCSWLSSHLHGSSLDTQSLDREPKLTQLLTNQPVALFIYGKRSRKYSYSTDSYFCSSSRGPLQWHRFKASQFWLQLTSPFILVTVRHQPRCYSQQLCFFSVPGSLLTSWAVKKYNLKIVYIFILVVFGMSFLIAPFLLPADTVALEDTDNSTVVTQYGNCNTQTIDAGGETKQVAPDHVLYVAIICVMIWGLGIGSVYVAYTAFYALLIPGGKEASYYGIKVTFGKVLTWLGPLLFTVINENTDKLQYTLALLGPFFLIAAVVTYFVDVDRGIADVSDTLHRRRGPAVLSVKIEEVNPMDLDNNTDNGGEPEVGLQKTISVVQENDSESNPDTAPSSATISPSTEL
uniref:Uncharacterized protein n=1 Tax=Mucochytrium quahogii TaxID=96639 RepID=A0A7S2RAT6_9STRA|mmetsp:Transcript_12247/g.26223  ORF Transcript_12247/g.26223 Transcript_12247/m.26223 type:complete len:376 (+) Transcript_12247:990-2117(+)